MSSHDTEVPPELREHTSGRHPVHIAHLVMGVAFLGVATVWALVVTGTVDLDRSRWLLPLPWLVAGGVGLLATVVRGHGYERHRP